MKYSLVLLLLIYALCSNAQTRDNVWFDADIKLMDGSEIKGEANYNIRDQIVQVIVGEKVLTYSEGQIQEMWLKNGDNEHQFMLVALKNKFDRVEYNLVEMIYMSKNHYSYLKRHTADKKVITSGPAASAPVPLGSNVTVFATVPTVEEVKANVNKDSFTSRSNFLSRRGRERLLINYDGYCEDVNRKNLFEALRDKQKEIKKYMKRNSLGTNMDEHMIAILTEYDRLKDAN